MTRDWKKAEIVCCSNGTEISQRENLSALEHILRGAGMTVAYSEYIYKRNGSEAAGTAQERAQALVECYRENGAGMIFDISGGDLANEILPCLSYEEIAVSPKIFWGYSDLTTVMNAIYAKTGKASILYQIRNLLQEENKELRAGLRDLLQMDVQEILGEERMASPFFRFGYERIQGGRLRGIVIGGNIRCFLKLAGTPYFPEVRGKVLFLESRSGKVPQMVTYLSQLQQMGVFQQAAGILLGTFSEMEGKNCQPDIVSLVRGFVPSEMPVVKTYEIGHGWDSKALVIGGEICL